MQNNILRRALINDLKVELIYLDQAGNFSQRIVSVKRLNQDSFVAFCHNKHQRRIFKYENILSVAIAKIRPKVKVS